MNWNQVLKLVYNSQFEQTIDCHYDLSLVIHGLSSRPAPLRHFSTEAVDKSRLESKTAHGSPLYLEQMGAEQARILFGAPPEGQARCKSVQI